MINRETEDHLERIVRKRILNNKAKIEHSLQQIAAGNPLGAETKPDRMVNRIAAKTGLSKRDSSAVSKLILQSAKEIDSGRGAEGGREALQGPTIDFIGVEFLSRGRLAANTVGRVVFRGGAPQGTGFLVGPGLFLTNNHVIETAEQADQMLVEFDFEAHSGTDLPVTAFTFNVARCFAFDPIERLDFTLIGIGQRVKGTKLIEAFGYIPLSDANDKHMLGEIANIIQHPLGQPKQIVVRENSLVSRDETQQVLHYLADTDRGSSGSPVCNNSWEPIALHHWGGPALEVKNPQGQPLRSDINEGIRVSAIVRALRDQVPRLAAQTGQAVSELLALWASASRPGPVAPPERSDPRIATASSDRAEARMQPDGSITWTFPIEISVRAPLINPPPLLAAPPPPPAPPSQGDAERGRRAEIDFVDRGGYEPGFIPGFVVPLPSFDAVPYQLAVNQRAAAGDDPHELRYHHFSIFMNADRRLAAVTACNIDGGRTVAVNREDKTTNPDPTLTQLGVESMGPEASDDFQPDPRVLDGEQMTIEFYSDQIVPGFPKPEFPGTDASPEERSAYARAMSRRTARMFQKGHIIMRGDPAWGLESEALAAEADTFFYTNAAPQLGYFNQGSAVNRPGAKGKLRWRAVETYVLGNAFMMRQRVCVFAGPIFDDEYDVEYRQGVKVPMRFFKIVVWAEGDGLRSIALIADQKPVLETLTGGVPEAAERFEDEGEVARVSEFLTTVADVAARTKLNFGAAIREADVRAGQEGLASATDATPSILGRTRRRGPQSPKPRPQRPEP